jgi:hypothetical protein
VVATEFVSIESSSTKSGWKRKYQIAEIESLDINSPLLQSFLAGLPSQAHFNKEWAEAGEMEYFYTARLEAQHKNSYSNMLQLKKEGKLEKREAMDLEDCFHPHAGSSSTQALRSLQDGEIKSEGAGEKHREVQKLLKEVKKLSAVMTHHQSTAFGVIAKVRNMAEEKVYLKELLAMAEKELTVFSKARDEVVEQAHSSSDSATDENIAKLSALLQIGQAHMDGFRSGSFHDAHTLVYGKDAK